MAEELSAPFSARNRGAHAQIDNECPETTRIGLLHILRELVAREYVEDWASVVRELERIARLRPEQYEGSAEGADRALSQLEWNKVFDFCERLYNHLTKDVYRWNGYSEVAELVTSRSDAQEYVAAELQRLFLEEHLALEFSDGLVRRRGRRNTAEQISRAELVLGDSRLAAACGHFNKALRYFRHVSQPDYENAVKDAVCAVEATARVLFPSGGSTLGDVIKSVTGSDAGQLPKAIAQTFHGLCGFRGGGEGVGHGGATGGPVTKEIAEYALAVSASQIVSQAQRSIL